MRLKTANGALTETARRWGWFLGFSAVFGVFTAYVFWGTWSCDVAAVMPDARTVYPSDFVSAHWWRDILEQGRFIPCDLLYLLIPPDAFNELRYAVALFASAVGLAFFLRGRGLSHLAAYGGGLLLAFCGYWMTLYSAGHLGWFRWMTYGVFAFAFADRAVVTNRLRHWLLLGAVVSWASFNQQDLWLLFTAFSAAYFLWCCVRERKFPWKGMMLSLAVFALIGIPNFRVVLGTTLKGRQEQIAMGDTVSQKDATEENKRWEFVTNWSMPVEDTLEFFNSRVHGDTSCPFVLSINRGKGVRPYTGALGRPLNAPAGNYRQHSLYVGWVTCLLALFGIFWGVREKAFRKEVLFFTVAAIAFYCFSLGRNFAPAYRFVFALPFGDLIRCPVKWHHLTELCLAVLAAYGIAGLSSVLSRVRAGALIVGALVLWGVADLARNDALYCAPVDISSARRQNLMSQMSILRRSDFANPQVAAMVRAGQIVSVANYLGNPDVFLVQVLQRHEPHKDKEIPVGIAILGILSFLTSAGVIGYVVVDCLSRRDPLRSGGGLDIIRNT